MMKIVLIIRIDGYAFVPLLVLFCKLSKLIKMVIFTIGHPVLEGKILKLEKSYEINNKLSNLFCSSLDVHSDLLAILF